MSRGGGPKRGRRATQCVGLPHASGASVWGRPPRAGEAEHGEWGQLGLREHGPSVFDGEGGFEFEVADGVAEADLLFVDVELELDRALGDGVDARG